MNRRSFITTAAWIFLLIGGFGLLSCDNDLEEIRRVITNRDVSIEKARDVEILYSDSAVVRVRIKGPMMERQTAEPDPHERFPDGVFVDFFGPDGKVTSTLTAREGLRYETKGKVVVRDSVVWESIEQQRLETEELIWDENTGRVFSNKFAVIRTPDEIIYGYGFEANQDFSRSRIRAIEGRIKVDDLAPSSKEEY